MQPAISTETADISGKNAPARMRMIKEIQRELETMTEAQRIILLLELRSMY